MSETLKEDAPVEDKWHDLEKTSESSHEDEAGVEKTLSAFEIMRARIKGRKYGKEALEVSEYLGKHNAHGKSKYEGDGVYIEEEPGEWHYDGDDPSTVTVYIDGKKEGERVKVLEYSSAGSNSIRRTVKEFHPGSWQEKMDALAEEAKEAKRKKKLAQAAERSEKFSPKGE